MNKQKGITLIALVVTIIVLLILASVTIATLPGDNGLFKKVSTAKEETAYATALEKIKSEVLGSYGNDGLIKIELLNKNLKNIKGLTYKDNQIDENDESKRINSLPDIVALDGYKFDIENNGHVTKSIDFEKLQSMYGVEVSAYNEGKNLSESKRIEKWRLLYVDKKNREAFLISSNTLIAPQPTERGITGRHVVNGEETIYTMEDFKNLEYAKKYNSIWIKNRTKNTTTGAVCYSAFMCDPDNWTDYKGEKAKYAVGGATFEIMLASKNNTQVEDYSSYEIAKDNGYCRL